MRYTHLVETPTHVFEVELRPHPDRPSEFDGSAVLLSGRPLTDDEMRVQVMQIVCHLAAKSYGFTNPTIQEEEP